MKSSFYPLCEYISEDKDSVDRKEPIYTSLILSTPGPFPAGRKDKTKKRESEIANCCKISQIDDNRRLAVRRCWLQCFAAPVSGTSDSRKHTNNRLQF